MKVTTLSVSRPATDERIGLVVAASLHVALIGWLAWRPPSVPTIPPPERMTVTITESVGLTSTSPEPQAEAAATVAPELGTAAPAALAAADLPPKPAPKQPPAQLEPKLPAPPPSPAPAKIVPPAPKPLPLAKPTTQPIPRPVPRPATPAARAPAATVPPSRIGSDFLKGAPSGRPASPAARPATASPGGTRIGDDFLKGVPGAQTSGPARSPHAATIGPAVQSALSGAISRKLKPHWAAPQGVDAEKLVTILSWNLNRDGSLAGTPQVVRQEGITDANRPQAARHAEQAIRAVQLAAPFDLPAEYYDAWKRVTSFRFDRKLSQ